MRVPSTRTQKLLNSLPEKGFIPIPGFSPSLSNPPSGCRFHPRCSLRKMHCTENHPDLTEINGRAVRCFFISLRADRLSKTYGSGLLSMGKCIFPGGFV
ncbi:oligopeptide/dipeptide ABC transporter ATP-binding protein [Methanosarcina horonobensis]|uniref:oligopeptide/dipeptide ABC transporter ATP-binding protein n=1 Tax=Methanosarcina horonobensis TaxID=418008 RepID=UPI0022B8D2E2|nr:oligopeptide/dipeptide ABC transporter ATP-binding protein [Methanosarcina horonobensis]